MIYTIWLPILGNDTQESAELRSKELSDKRLSHYWDGNKLTMAEWKKVLKTEASPWDVYYLYDSKSQWKSVTIAPVYWQQQLQSFKDLAPKLNREELEKKIKEMIAEIK